MKNSLTFLVCKFWMIAASFAAVASLQAATNAPVRVTQSDSAIIKGARIYSIRFPGGRASEFFGFLRTNGFAGDNIMFAGRAGEVYVPEFDVHNVRLKEVAKSLEFVTEGRLNVEVVEQGETSDVNIWRIKLAEGANLKTRACGVPFLLLHGPDGKPRSDGKQRVMNLVEAVERTLESERSSPRGTVNVLESEKMVVIVGAESYVEAVANALETAERNAQGIPPK